MCSTISLLVNICQHILTTVNFIRLSSQIQVWLRSMEEVKGKDINASVVIKKFKVKQLVEMVVLRGNVKQLV